MALVAVALGLSTEFCPAPPSCLQARLVRVLSASQPCRRSLGEGAARLGSALAQSAAKEPRLSALELGEFSSLCTGHLEGMLELVAFLGRCELSAEFPGSDRAVGSPSEAAGAVLENASVGWREPDRAGSERRRSAGADLGLCRGMRLQCSHTGQQCCLCKALIPTAVFLTLRNLLKGRH